MKKIKAIVALLLCALLIFSFASCGKKELSTDGNIPDAQETEQTLEQVGLSLDKLVGANEIEALLGKYGCLTVKHETSGGESHTKQIFNYNGGVVLVSRNGASGDISGWIKGFDFYTENGRIKAAKSIVKLNAQPEFPENDMLVKSFEGKKLVALGSYDEYYKLSSLSEDKSENGKRLFFFDKTTLALEKITYENTVGYTETTVITCGDDLDAYSKKVTDAFDGEMKKVKILGQYSDGTDITDINAVLELPASWEYVPTGAEKIEYCMDENFSVQYQYPGDGKDYTLYITNIFDDDISGKK